MDKSTIDREDWEHMREHDTLYIIKKGIKTPIYVTNKKVLSYIIFMERDSSAANRRATHKYDEDKEVWSVVGM